MYAPISHECLVTWLPLDRTVGSMSVRRLYALDLISPSPLTAAKSSEGGGVLALRASRSKLLVLVLGRRRADRKG